VEDDDGNFSVIDKDVLLPWRWTAPESIERREFSMMSDIWMYGTSILQFRLLDVKNEESV